MQAFFVAFGLTVAYGAVHSLLAATQTKRFARHIMGERTYEGLYRLFFNTMAVVLLLPIVWIVLFEPGDTVWRVYFPLNVLFYAIQGVGVLGLLVSLLQIDGSRFLGMSQLMHWFEGRKKPLPDEPLATSGVYALMRHPLYLFSLMIIWPVVTMSEAWLGFGVGATLYFLVGSIFEEHKLRQAFGSAYEQYQRRVPWFLPTGWWRRSSSTSDRS